VLHSFVLAAGRWTKNLTYVALTRHKEGVGLYGGRELFKDVDAMKSHMSRWGMKDSVLDFPLMFMERRGLNTDGLVAKFAQRCFEKVGGLAQEVEKVVSPDTYYPRQTEKPKKRLSYNKP
jgi:hypothetical protein